MSEAQSGVMHVVGERYSVFYALLHYLYTDELITPDSDDMEVQARFPLVPFCSFSISFPYLWR